MTTLHNEILINASPEKVWSVLTDLDALEHYDPGIKKSVITTSNKTGLGATRKCDIDSKNWFKEKITQWEPHEAITFELTECSLPVHKLSHSYAITPMGPQTKISQTMQYEMKMGLLGKLMDVVMIRKKWDTGIKKFFAGLKEFTESK